MKLGLDIGSTTIKCVLLDDSEKIVYKTYKRHFSHIKENCLSIFNELDKQNLINSELEIAISGSAGMGLSDSLGIPFVQEVFATKLAAQKMAPNTDVIIELGGEDAKILFLTNGIEVRMNGTCAGGTGAFIDQMATLLNTDVTNLNLLAQKHKKLYSIASRCGVFAKSDIQPLLNEGAKKEDIAASIFKSVVNQTIGGLAQGRTISGNILYLGGPLTFLSELRKSFDESLNLVGASPNYSLYYVAIGSAFSAKQKYNFKKLITLLENSSPSKNYAYNPPLFKNEQELDEFRERHNRAKIESFPLTDYDKKTYLGIDCGSTTLKVVLIDEDELIRYQKYLPNKGNPVNVLRKLLIELYDNNPKLNIACSASTGYGEEIVKQAFSFDGGLVETMAHLRAAKKFQPNVDFIIDIGGQDIKCFKIENGIISNIFLNEACSSGCGSFLQTFANALGRDIKEFAKLGLLADKPVDLGSRCTVFMNSSVKQAQKDGATIENISAGLSISVVKNALYKVIRTANAEMLGEHIVVQGGTFYNEAVLRAFERELNRNVVRPNIAGLMGAYGAALYAKQVIKKEKSSIINLEQLKNFKIKTTNIKCGLCNNHCSLTISSFNDGKKYISGNNCERPLKKKNSLVDMNLYESIRERLSSYKPVSGPNGKIGIPLTLNIYELLPFWHTLFTSLGFEVIFTDFATNESFVKGQHTIPSDTVCFPAKLAHGAVLDLIEQKIPTIFYPSMTYNIDEGKGQNHYNCPVVAYYPESIKNNVEALEGTTFIYDNLKLDSKTTFKYNFDKLVKKYFPKLKKSEVNSAIDKAYDEYRNYLTFIREKGQDIISRAEENNIPIIVLAGRPYHVDPLINHGIDKIVNSFGAAVVTESSIAYLQKKFQTNVLNQWTYHARIYDAAKYITKHDNMNLVQLVSFGCGLDAITTDETKEILEAEGKIYTQIKIDEIANQGAVKIRLRSLLSALAEREEK